MKNGQTLLNSPRRQLHASKSMLARQKSTALLPLLVWRMNLPGQLPGILQFVTINGNVVAFVYVEQNFAKRLQTWISLVF